MKDYQLSKKLSFILRHKPESADILLDKEGWVDLKILCNAISVNQSDVERVVRENDKQRFQIKNGKIKANQGHSVKGVIAFPTKPKIPPEFLYHGTVFDTWRYYIQHEGLKPMKRHHVHLSPDVETATKVALRWKKDAVILKVHAREMKQDFYLSDNGIWLTDFVPPEHISLFSYTGIKE